MSEQSTHTDFIANVPGHSGEAYVPAARVIDEDPNQTAIAHELRRQAADRLMQVTGQGGLDTSNEAHQYPEAPQYDGEERSPYLPTEDLNVPKPTVSGESSDIEPVAAETIPVAGSKTQAEVDPDAIWNRIAEASAERRSGNQAPKFGGAAITSARDTSE